MAPTTHSQKKASRPDDEAVFELTDTDQVSRGQHLRKAEAFSYRSYDTSRSKRRVTPDNPVAPRRFTINLGLPPEQRYLELSAAFRDEMLNLRGLFDEVVGGMVKFIPNVLLKWICWVLLRGVYDEEENAELKVSSIGSRKSTTVD